MNIFNIREIVIERLGDASFSHFSRPFTFSKIKQFWQICMHIMHNARGSVTVIRIFFQADVYLSRKKTALQAIRCANFSILQFEKFARLTPNSSSSCKSTKGAKRGSLKKRLQNKKNLFTVRRSLNTLADIYWYTIYFLKHNHCNEFS